MENYLAVSYRLDVLYVLEPADLLSGIYQSSMADIYQRAYVCQNMYKIICNYIYNICITYIMYITYT